MLVCINFPSNSLFYFNFSIGIGFAHLNTLSEAKTSSSALRVETFLTSYVSMLPGRGEKQKKQEQDTSKPQNERHKEQ